MLGTNWLFQTVTFDELCWIATIYVFARLLRSRDTGPWVVEGGLLGLGLETNLTIVGLGAGLAAALLMTPLRRQLRRRWPWLGLSPAEQLTTAIVAGNYGEAGTMDVYGPAFDLPEALSPHLTFWYSNPGHVHAQTVITAGIQKSDVRPFFADIKRVDAVRALEGVHSEAHGHPIGEPKCTWSNCRPTIGQPLPRHISREQSTLGRTSRSPGTHPSKRSSKSPLHTRSFASKKPASAVATDAAGERIIAMSRHESRRSSRACGQLGPPITFSL